MLCIYIICYKRLYSDTHWLYRYLLKLFEHNFHTFINYGAAITEGTHVSNIIYLCSFLPAEKLSEQMNRLSQELTEHKARIFHTHTHTRATPIYCERWKCISMFLSCGIGLWHFMGLSSDYEDAHTLTHIPTSRFTHPFSRTHLSLSVSPQTHCSLTQKCIVYLHVHICVFWTCVGLETYCVQCNFVVLCILWCYDRVLCRLCLFLKRYL
jgi:hypothetical protein